VPIQNTDVLLKLATTAGVAGNANASTPNASLGKYISTTQITDAILNNLFDNISGAENAASTVDYRCIFIHNAHATLTWQSVVAYLLSEVAGGASIAIGVDPTAASAIGSASAQAVTIANETTAPAGVTFTAPTTLGAGIAIGDIAPGQCRAIWVRRTAAVSAALSNDGVTLRLQGNSL
jgi:hypothetical protein